ncbi:MAG TPA: metalloregulator ArsR/SmtB family transcription factor [Acidobacteriaceae bacterium]
MSRRSGAAGRRAQATVFAALGDETRLALLARLYDGRRRSIAELTEGSKLTRQAITKHLRVLERVRVVHSVKEGRESLFEFNPQPMEDLKDYLEVVSRQWDEALLRLKAFVEE